ncbi:IMP 5'-nucleotidase Ecym_5451 [Eremothecium cymbalariae DBVPG|uniref:IMP-specific 5'-nucleotidase 1 n=1 Tax=Eremothecium cymbalariae (strain CBS 270.75 / DBVPG 7215 / KCTC 17166 / NRRL Y-17582) TaxID=931890 RepID=I6NDQ8_ERECY|nr:hypothetical protein Ecym_5451 [Eremothecium cymbalariae DBVPG\
MSSRYRVEYHLKTHRKDQFIDWIKGLLAVPFVLHSVTAASTAREKYKNVFIDIENLIEEKRKIDSDESLTHGLHISRLDRLVPSIGRFFTPLPLAEAFLQQDEKRAISARTLVSPSFNDIRQILNTAQILQVARSGELRMLTFDGDVTIYEDGGSLAPKAKIVTRLIRLLEMGLYIGIVTAAGYDDSENYEQRLVGLIKELEQSPHLSLEVKKRLCVMGGESNFLFQYDEENSRAKFKKVSEYDWMPQELHGWGHEDIKATLDLAETTFKKLKQSLKLPPETTIIRKNRAVGIVPGQRWDPELQEFVRVTILRESLEELVLSVKTHLDAFPPAQRIKYSCFDGGSDVWCDIGGKDLGIQSLQYFNDPLNPIKPNESLHIGDQFAPVGSANDFKARLSGCTVWISSPQETLETLDEIIANWKKN